MSPFDPLAILEALERHRVDYVVVGAWAVEAQGVQRSHPTQDIDITPRRASENLDRLSGALRELDVRIRTDAVPEGLRFGGGASEGPARATRDHRAGAPPWSL